MSSCEVETKECSSCLEELPLDAFGVDNTKKSGLRAMCRKCRNPKVREYDRSDKGYLSRKRACNIEKDRRRGDPEYAEYRREIVRKSSANLSQKIRKLSKSRSPEGRMAKRAHDAVAAAIKRGDLVRPRKCQACSCDPGLDVKGRTKIGAYHFMGYAVEHHLTVVFICTGCLNNTTAIPRRRIEEWQEEQGIPFQTKDTGQI